MSLEKRNRVEVQLVWICIDDLRRIIRGFPELREIEEDIIQETLLEAYIYLRTLREEDKICQWMSRICRHVCIRSVYKIRKIKNIEISINSTYNYDEFSLEDSIESKDLDITENIINKIEFNRCMELISGREFEVLRLHCVVGYSYEKLAEIFNCPLNTIRSKIARCRAKLRRLIEEE